MIFFEEKLCNFDKMSNLAFDERHKDVTFVFEGSDIRIRAHKCILEAVSPVFERMFSGSLAKEDEILITDIAPEVFELLIRYVVVLTIDVFLDVSLYLKLVRFI